MSFITVPEVLATVFFIILCFAYIFLKDDFQAAVFKYISWILIIIPVACYVATRLTFLPNGLKDFSTNFLPESIGILLTFFVIENFYKHSEKMERKKKIRATIGRYLNPFNQNLEKLIIGHYYLFLRKDFPDSLNATYPERTTDWLHFIKDSDLNAFQGYLLDATAIEIGMSNKTAQDLINDSYEALQDILSKIWAETDPYHTPALYNTTYALIASRSLPPTMGINFKQSMKNDDYLKFITSADLNKPALATPGNYFSPTIHNAKRNKSFAMNLLEFIDVLETFMASSKKKIPAA